MSSIWSNFKIQNIDKQLEEKRIDSIAFFGGTKLTKKYKQNALLPTIIELDDNNIVHKGFLDEKDKKSYYLIRNNILSFAVNGHKKVYFLMKSDSKSEESAELDVFYLVGMGEKVKYVGKNNILSKV